MSLVRGGASARVVGVVLVAFVAQTTSGCLSNEYTIQRDELRRLAAIPPEVRGEHVKVSQDLGERRGDALEAEEVRTSVSDQATLDLRIYGGGSGGGGNASSGNWRGPSGGSGGSWRGTPPAGTTAPSGGWHGTPTAGTAPSGGWHGTPTAGTTAPSGGWRGAPPSGGGGSSSGGGGIDFGGGGGGGGGGDAWAAVVVAIIVGAAVATVVLAASEGMRFAGDAQLSPDQTIYVKDAYGGQHLVALGALTPEEAAHADVAVVKDDEGYGLRRLAHGPIDRSGGTFRFELGGGAFNFGQARASGLASHIQLGLYVTPKAGLVLDLGLDGGDVDPSCCVGPIVGPTSLRRDSISLQLEVMPVAFGPFRLGAFGGGGVAIAGPSGAREEGGMATGGVRLELELTAHMALSARAGTSIASLPSGWSTAGSVTGGLAIY